MNFLAYSFEFLGLEFAIIDLAALLILIIFMIVGIAKGLSGQIASLLGPFAALIISIFTCKPISKFLLEKIPAIKDSVGKLVTKIFNYDLVASTKEQAIEKLNSSNLPAFLKTVFNNLINSNGEEYWQNLTEKVQATLTNWMVVVFAFIAIFIVCLIVFAIIKGILKAIRNNKTVISKVDRFFGMLFGILKGFVFVVVVAALLSFIPFFNDMLNATSYGSVLNKILSFVFEIVMKNLPIA